MTVETAKENHPSAKHGVTLTDRTALTLSGVLDIHTCDEHTVTAETTAGALTVEGNDLHVRRLSPEEGLLTLDGTVNALYYTDTAETRGSFLSRLFR